MQEVVLLLGGNIGDVRGTFRKASDAIAATVGPVVRRSSVYRSPAWGFTAESDFLNELLVVSTALPPGDVLAEILGIEAQLGRERKSTGAYESRSVDIDILFYGLEMIEAPGLQVPHPRLHQRRFALEPLNEVMPDFVHPVLGKSMAMLLKECTDPSMVEKLGSRYIVIEGNIGAGKTTLASMLAQEMDARLVPEEFSDNPFLPGFYADPAKYAFPLELSFLAERYQQLKSELQPQGNGKDIVSDYYILKSLVFAKINLPEIEFNLFNKLFGIMFETLVPPDILVFLHSDTGRLQKNIKQRGRSYEQQIKNEYLERIHESYMESLHALNHLPILIIDTSGIDFVTDAGAFKKLMEMVNTAYPKGLHYVNSETFCPGT